MSTVWRAFDEVGPAAALLLPAMLLVASLVGAFVLRVSPVLARVLAAGAVAVALVLVLVMTMRPAAAGLGVRVEPLLDPTVSLEALLRPSPGRRLLRLEALGNLLLLMPLGAALRFLTGWRPAALLVVAVAVAVETAQWALATGRVPDVLDLLLNTAGGLAGVAMASAAIAAVAATAPPRGGTPGPGSSGGAPRARSVPA